MIKEACIVASGAWGGHRALLKNRDRNYNPSLKIVHRILNGVEVLYVYDEETGWAEGLNEHGVGIVNAALMVGRDEAEKKLVKSVGKKSKDGERIIEALGKKTLRAVLESLKSFKGGIKGHTLVSNPRRSVSLEMTSKHEAVVKELVQDRIHVRTNHGFDYEDAGYTEGDRYVSSIARREKAKDVLDDVSVVDDIAPALWRSRKEDRKHPNNMVRDHKMWTSSQMVLDLDDLELRLYLIPDKVTFLGYENQLPQDYSPVLTYRVFQYVEGKDAGEDLENVKPKTIKTKSKKASEATMTFNPQQNAMRLMAPGDTIETLVLRMNKGIQRMNEYGAKVVTKPAGAAKAFNFAWSNAQGAWHVMALRDFPYHQDANEFTLFIGREALSPLGKPWSLTEMQYVAKRLNRHPLDSRESMVRRVAGLA